MTMDFLFSFSESDTNYITSDFQISIDQQFFNKKDFFSRFLKLSFLDL